MNGESKRMPPGWCPALVTRWFEQMIDRLQSAFVVLAGYLPIVAWGRERHRRTTISQRVNQRDDLDAHEGDSRNSRLSLRRRDSL